MGELWLERISLGVKQLDQDPFSNYIAANPKGSIVTGKVLEVDAKGATVELEEGVEGYLRASELSRERVEDARNVLKEGEEVEARFVGIDRKSRSISLSVKAKEMAEEQAVMDEYKSSDSASTSLGDLLRQQLDDK